MTMSLGPILYKHSSLAFSLLMALGVGCAHADSLVSSYPTHPVKIVVPSQPGGGTDIVARVLAQELTGLGGAIVFY